MMTWNGPGALLVREELIKQGGEIPAALVEKMDEDFLKNALADGRITKAEGEEKPVRKSAKSKSDEVPE